MSSMTNHRAWKLILSQFFAEFSFSQHPTSVAHDGEHKHPIRQVKPDEMYLPTPIPDRIVLTWAGSPYVASGHLENFHGSLTWLAELAPATHGPEFQSTAIRIEAKTEYLKTDINEAHFHSACDSGPSAEYSLCLSSGRWDKLERVVSVLNRQ